MSSIITSLRSTISPARTLCAALVLALGATACSADAPPVEAPPVEAPPEDDAGEPSTGQDPEQPEEPTLDPEMQPGVEGAACSETAPCADALVCVAEMCRDENDGPFRVIETVASHDTVRYVQYDLLTGELYVVGEQQHGLDYHDTSGNDLWYCGLNTDSPADGLLWFLMKNSPDAEADKQAGIEAGWSTYDLARYHMLRMQPLANQQSFFNSVANETSAYTAAYAQMPSDELFIQLYGNEDNGKIYIGVAGGTVEAAAGLLPPGDGTSDRDNGVRVDVAFKQVIPMSQSAQAQLVEEFEMGSYDLDDTARAYFHHHAAGL